MKLVFTLFLLIVFFLSFNPTMQAVVYSGNDGVYGKKEYKRQRRGIKKNIRAELRKLRNERCKSKRKKELRLDQNEVKNDYRKIHPLALLVLLAMILTPLYFYMYFVISIGTPTLLLRILHLVGLFIVLLSPFLGLAGIKEINNQPDKYKGKKIIYTWLWMLILFCIILFIAILVSL